MNLRTLLALSALALAVTSCAGTPPQEPQATPEGLVAVRSSQLDELYVRPNTNLAQYRGVLIDPVPVELRSDFVTQRHAYNRIQPMYPRFEDAARLTGDVAASVQTALAEAFRSQGYNIAVTPEAGVLRLSAKVSELFVNAPERVSPWITRILTRDAGQATVSLEVRDASTGTVLARVVHHLIAREISRINLADDVSNRLWLDTAFRRWAANCATATGISGRTEVSTTR